MGWRRLIIPWSWVQVPPGPPLKRRSDWCDPKQVDAEKRIGPSNGPNNSVDYANKRVNSAVTGGTQTCCLYDSGGRSTTTTMQAVGTCPTAATNVSTSVKYGVLGLVAETTKPALTASDGNRTGRWGTAFSGAGRARQSAAPDPVTGFLPPLAADAGSESCKRAADGAFRMPGVDVSGGPQCGARKFSVTSNTYYPSGVKRPNFDWLPIGGCWRAGRVRR